MAVVCNIARSRANFRLKNSKVPTVSLIGSSFMNRMREFEETVFRRFDDRRAGINPDEVASLQRIVFHIMKLVGIPCAVITDVLVSIPPGGKCDGYLGIIPLPIVLVQEM